MLFTPYSGMFVEAEYSPKPTFARFGVWRKFEANYALAFERSGFVDTVVMASTVIHDTLIYVCQY